MASRILFKRNSNSGVAPSAGSLVQGEIALNTADGKVFLKKEDNTVLDITKTTFERDTSITASDDGGATPSKIIAKVDGVTEFEVTATGTEFTERLTMKDQKAIRFNDANNSNYVEIKAPDDVSFSYSLKLPSFQPIDRSVLSLDGNGNLEWGSADSFGGNRVYVSDRKGDDANDGINAPVRTLKRGAQIAASLGLRPLTDPGQSAYNAKRLLEANRSFIQSQVIKWIDANFVNFQYDEDKCRRDLGFIIDAVGFDFTLGTNFNAVTTGLSYRRANSAYLIDNQILQTKSAILKAQEEGLAYVTNSTALSRYNLAFNEIVDILENEGIDDSTDAIVYPNPTGVDANRSAAKDKLQANRSFLRAEVIAWINTNFSDFTYDTDKCRRDTGLLLDAAGFDMVLGTNYNSVVAGRAYLRANANYLQNNQLLQTKAAFQYAKTQVLASVTGTPISFSATGGVDYNLPNGTGFTNLGTPQLSATTAQWTNTALFNQLIGLPSGTTFNFVAGGITYTFTTTTAWTFDNVNSYTVNGTTDYPGFAMGVSVQSLSATVDSSAVARQRLTLAFDEILDILDNAEGDDSTDAIVFTAPAGVDQNNIDARDLLQSNRNFLADAVTAYINKQFTGYVYNYGVKDTCERDLGIIIDAARFDAALGTNYNAVTSGLAYQRANSSYVLAGQNLQTLEAIRFAKTQSLTAVAANGTTVNRVSAAFDEIIDIFQNGVVSTETSADALVFPNPTTASQNVINAKNQLINNRAFLQDEVVAYVNANTPPAGATYTEGVDYTTNGIVWSADPPATDGLLRLDLSRWPNTAGYANFISQSVGTPVSFTDRDAGLTITGTITSISDFGPTGAWVYISFTSNPYGSTSGFNRGISAITVGLVGAEPYDQVKCRRDVGFIVDGLTYDIIYGGNSASVAGARAYFVGSVSQLGAGQATATINAYTHLQTVIENVVQGIAVTPTSGNTTTQQGVGPGGNATTVEATLINDDLQLYIDVITAGDTNSLPTPTLPSLSWVNANIVSATNALATAKPTIITNTSTYLTTTFDQFIYDSDKCKRDTRYIADALTYDILYGGNTATRTAAGAYWVGTTTQVNDQIFQTKNAYEYLSTIVDNVLLGVSVTPSQDRVVYTKGSGATNAFTVTDWTENTLTLEATGNSNGTAFLAKFTALFTVSEPYNIYVNGTEVTVSNTVINTSTVTLTTSKTVGQTLGGSHADTANIINISIVEAYNGVPQVGVAISLSPVTYSSPTDYTSNGVTVSSTVNFGSVNKIRLNTTNWSGFGYVSIIEFPVGSTFSVVVGGTTHTGTISGEWEPFASTFEAFVTWNSPAPDFGGSFVTAESISLEGPLPAVAGTSEVNQAVELIGIIANVVENGLTALPTAINPDVTFADANLQTARTELIADRQGIIDGTITFIQTTFQDFVYDNVKCSRDVGYIVDGLTYDILYQGNSATVRSADAYWITLDGSTYTTQVPGQQSVTAQAIQRLSYLVDRVVRGVTITDTYQNAVTQITSGSNADQTTANELTGLINIITTVITDGIGTLPAVSLPDTSWVAGGITANLTSFRTTNRNTIINAVIQYIADTFTGFTYNQAICSRDTGLIVDAVILDLILSGNERTREAGLAYYESGNASALLVRQQQLFETVEANKYAKRIAMQISANQTISPFFTPVGAEPTQVKYPSITVDSAEMTRIGELFDVVINIFQGDPAPALDPNRFQQIPITIQCAAGDFYIDNPIIIPDLCSVVGDSLRSVTVRPLNAGKDMFRIRNGAYMTGFTFRDGLDANLVPSYTFNWCVAFDDANDDTVDRNGYFGLRNDKPRITLSPYIQNCSIISFLGGNGIWVDGSKIRDPNISPPGFEIEQENPVEGATPPQGKSMVANAFTMVSFGGTGWLCSNDGYAQVVSCFQIFCLNGSYTQSGGYLSITNSATNFGLYALRSSGFSPNAFSFDRAFVANTGTSGGRVTLTTIGQARIPTAQFVLKFRNADTDADVTNNFKSASTELTFNAATDVNPVSNLITIDNHGLLNGDSVVYESDYLTVSGNTVIPGMIDNSIYYVSIVSLNTFRLFNDNGLAFPVDITGTGIGTQRITKNVEEFFVETVETSHNVYQELTLPPGPSYTFGIGTAITGTTGAFTNNAYVLSWNNTTRKLIISNELTTVGEEQQRVKFTTLSTITTDQSPSPFTAIPISAVADRTDLYTATFKTNSTKTASQIQSPGGTIGLKCNFHRPSILNSSSHTWEYAGSGTDYNALPQNGGQGVLAFEQFTELPGRVYSSGTDEFGNFKVGDFIKAENNTGKITFRTEVTVGQLNVLRLSLSSIEISAISNDIGLGDNEIGGASDTRLPTQRSVRLFINNRLGNVLDKAVSTNAVAGALVQLNSQGLINADLIPPLRGVTTYATTEFGGRLLLSEKIPPVEVFNGDNASETYQQQTLTLTGGTLTAVVGDIITQNGTTGSGRVKEAVTGGTSVTLYGVTGTFTEDNAAQTIRKNGTTVTGVYPSGLTAVAEIVDNYFLNNDNSSQFLILDGPGYAFTNGNNIKSAIGLAEGEITEYREGVLYSLNLSTLNGGSSYTPGSGSQTYTNVSLTNVSGTGTGATADITVTNGAVSDVSIISGGSGYDAGDIVSASSSNIGGSGSGFQITVSRADTRLYVELIGDKTKFNASTASPDFFADNNAPVDTIANLATFATFTFNAQSTGSGGDVNTTTSRITLSGHGLSNGDAVIYSNQSNTSIGGLVNNRGYFIKVIDSSTVELYSNYALGAGDQILFTSSSTGNHTLTRNIVTIGTTNLCFFRIAGHGLSAGDPVLISGSDLPAGLVSGNYYFIGSVSVNTFTLHTLRSNALASVGGTTTGKVTVTDVGSGSATFTLQNVTFTDTINDSSKFAANWGSVSVTTIDASNVVSGVFATSRLAGTGTANDQTFLRGDSEWALAVQGIRKVTDSAISLTGDSYVDGLNTVYYNVPVLDVEKVDGDGGDTNFTNYGVARYDKSQFTVGRALNTPADPGTISIKTGVIDAGFLSGQPGTYYTNPDNLSKAVPVLKGGTGLTTYNQGDLIVATAGGALTQLGIGAINSVLTSNGTNPSWSTTLALGGDLTAPGAVFNGNIQSTSTTTGSVRITGGIGMTGNAFIGGNLTVSGAINFNSSLSITGDDAAITLSPGGTGTVSIQPAGVTTIGTLGIQTSLVGNLNAVANQQTINFAPTGTLSAITINPAGTLTLGAGAAGGIVVSSDITSSGDIAVNGGDITTTATTFNLVDANATTVNFARAGTAITIGANNLGTTTVRNNLTVTGDLTVNGTNSTISATSVTIADNAIQLAQRTTPTDAVANGGGIILKGTTDHTILWDTANANWTLSEHVNISTGKAFKVNNVNVLTATGLGTSVVSSSLTSVGTLSSGTWNAGVIAGQYGGTGVANTGKTITIGGNLTTSGAFNTTITVTNTTNVTLPTSGTLVGSNDTGTVTNTMLAGSIANAKLTNSSITLNGTLVNLGDTVTITSNLPNALTVGTGLVLDSGTTFNGSAARTISIANTVATTSGIQTLTNKTFTDSSTLFQDDADNTKKMSFELSGVSTGVTRTLTVPNVNGTIITTGDTSTVTNTMLAGSIANAKLANSTISGISLGSNLNTLTAGSFLTWSVGTNYNGSAASTLAVNATNANTGNTVVNRDASGNFSAGTITATLSGLASAATNIRVSATDYAGSTSSAANTVALRDANQDIFANLFRGTATTARYADLAENYRADAEIEAGTVVCFGGEAEVTTCNVDGCRKVAGIVSTNPAYLMNSDLQGEKVVALALQGRVPCKVTGKIRKGDMLVAAGNGHARAEEDPKLGQVIGKALENFDGESGVIEVVVGRM